MEKNEYIKNRENIGEIKNQLKEETKNMKRMSGILI